MSRPRKAGNARQFATVTALKRPPSDLARELRRLADEADAGRVTEYVASACVDGRYDFFYGASIQTCVVMATMLLQNCIDRMRR